MSQNDQPVGRPAAVWALYGLGVAALVVGAIARGGSLTLWLVVGGVAAVTCAVVMTVMSRSAGGRHAAVVASNPGAEVLEVWGAAGLHDALLAEGFDATGVRRNQGTALSLVVQPHGLALWGGSRTNPRRVAELGWDRVVDVVEGRGVVANNGPRPAVAFVTTRGNQLVVCPSRNPAGGLMTADQATVRSLVSRLGERRLAA